MRNPRDGFKGIFCILAGLLMLLIISGAVQAVEIDMEIIAEIESGGNPRAVGRAGEIGLYQIMAITLRGYNQRHEHSYTRGDLFDPEINYRIADWYLNIRIPEMLSYYRIPITITNLLWSYNAGIGQVLNNIMPGRTREYIEIYRRLT